MPELPEVEVTRLGIEKPMTGARILDVRLGQPLRWPLGCPPDTLIGQRILGVRRRGKYLMLDMERGLLLIHLGMSGSLRFSKSLPERAKHDHFEMETTKGTLRLNDPRRFGAVVYARDEHSGLVAKLLAGLGAEPLDADFDTEAFARGLKSRSAPVKQVLLAGDLVVGAGNIYASEALFHAGIRPTTPANRLSRPRALRLCQAVRDVLAHAISIGGTTLRNFSSAAGKPGYFQYEAMVYDREGQPCRVCGTPIRRIVQGQRATFFCPRCQKP